MGRRRVRWPLIGIAIAMVGAGAFLYADAELNKPHFTRGDARIDGYALTDDPARITLLFATGAGDVVDEAVAVEEPSRVTVTVRTFVFVPARGGFKNLAAYFGQRTVALRQPLGERAVIDGTTGRPVAKRIAPREPVAP